MNAANPPHPLHLLQFCQGQVVFSANCAENLHLSLDKVFVVDVTEVWKTYKAVQKKYINSL